jgi:molecular chaperone GrpE
MNANKEIKNKKGKTAMQKAESETMQNAVESTMKEGWKSTDELTQCKATLAEWQEKYARLTADLENYQKRTMKERGVWAEAAQEKILLPILSIVDNFARAMEHMPEVPEQMQTWVDGITMIQNSFKDFLKNAGVQEVSYEAFNPELHEALMQVDSDEKESGEIVMVMEKGYMLKDRVLRPAKVSVAK